VLSILILSCLGSSCQSGSYQSERRASIERKEAWESWITSQAIGDQIYYLNNKGDVSLVSIRAVALNAKVLAALNGQFPDEPRLYQKIYQWTKQGRSVVIAGIYSKNLKPEDLIKNNRFRLSLITSGGRSVAVSKEIVNPVFAADYFPIFSNWDKIVALSFKADLNYEPTLLIQWPSGQRQLSLTAPAALAGIVGN
jgi:hypothetical protein